MGLSVMKLVLILLIVLVIFGASRLPQIMGDIGKGMRALRDGLKGEDETQKAEQPAHRIEQVQHQDRQNS